MIYSAINCYSIHMYESRDFIKKNIYILVYDQMILSFNYTMSGNYQGPSWPRILGRSDFSLQEN